MAPKQTNKQMLEQLLERTEQAPPTDGAVQEMAKTMAVLVDGVGRMERQLEKQNGGIREAVQTLTSHDVQLQSVVGYVAENRQDIKDNAKAIEGLKITTAKLTVLIGGGTTIGTAIGYGIGYALKLATGG